jgi:prophage DNA circulation protein
MRDDAAATSTGWQDVVASFTDPRSAQTFVDTFLPGLVASQAAATAGSASPVAQACLDNRADLDLLIVVSAVSASAEVASAATYTAYDEAIATRDALATQIAAVAEYCVDPDTYASLMDLQAAASIAISDEAIELPRITTYEVTTPRTAIEIAHALYGDATRADEIVSRNRIADPNSVCGTLRVLVV